MLMQFDKLLFSAKKWRAKTFLVYSLFMCEKPGINSLAKCCYTFQSALYYHAKFAVDASSSNDYGLNSLNSAVLYIYRRAWLRLYRGNCNFVSRASSITMRLKLKGESISKNDSKYSIARFDQSAGLHPGYSKQRIKTLIYLNNLLSMVTASCSSDCVSCKCGAEVRYTDRVSTLNGIWIYWCFYIPTSSNV